MLGLVSQQPLLAQGEGGQAAYDAAFEAMMADLGNPEKSFAYVVTAVEVGDLRGAIAALERVLLIRPDLANVKMELGLLYRAAGAPETAETYLAEAEASGEVPAEYQERLEQEIAAAQAARAPHRLTGSFFLGGRYETNANAGPDSRSVRIGSDVIPLLDEDTEQSDVSAIAALSLNHRYDLGRQSGDELLTDLVLYGNRYADETDSNVALIDLTVGPRFYWIDTDLPFNVRPFATGSVLWLADSFYRAQAGGGLSAEQTFHPRVRGDLTIRGVYQSLSSSSDNQNASDRTGPFFTLDPGLTFELTPSTYLRVRGRGQLKYAREDFESYAAVGGGVSLTQYFPSQFAALPSPWSASLSADYMHFRYDDPDPVLDPDSSQRDDRLDLGLSLNVPFAASWEAVAEVTYTDNNSNYDTEDFDNLAVMLGVTYRFSLLP
jgi:tetratricopeptide (TPR) repeat protein